MANTQSAKKRIRQNAKRQARNRRYISGARTYVKRTRELAEAGDVEGAELALREASSLLDKAARKRIIHPRNAARRKGRLMAFVAKMKKAA